MTTALTRRRGMSSGLVAVVTLAVVAFFVGIRQESEPYNPVAVSGDERNPETPLALSHEELSDRGWGSSPQRWTPQQLPERVPVSTKDAAAKTAAMALRATRRAFEGAPPTIPHPVAQDSGVYCRACHQDGGMIGATVAPRMSHAAYTMCTQCHVPDVASLPSVDPLQGAAAVGSTFVGQRGPVSTFRWGPGSPPQTPHRTLMREQCISCHGPTGKPGLQTSHPERHNCEQCHAPTAVVDQRAAF